MSPAGTETVTFSPFFLPSRARPTGLSLLIRPSVGLASVEPTMVKLCEPSGPSTLTVEPIWTWSLRGVLVDQRRVLDQRLDHLDPALDEGLLVLGVLVLGVLGEVAVLLGVVDPLGDLRPADGHHLLELVAELVEAVLADVGGLVVHGVSYPGIRKEPQPRVFNRALESEVGREAYNRPGGVSKDPPSPVVSGGPRGPADGRATGESRIDPASRRTPCRRRRSSRRSRASECDRAPPRPRAPSLAGS